MAEWSNASVLKTEVPLRGPGVRIPPPPLLLRHSFSDGEPYAKALSKSYGVINPYFHVVAFGENEHFTNTKTDNLLYFYVLRIQPEMQRWILYWMYK